MAKLLPGSFVLVGLAVVALLYWSLGVEPVLAAFRHVQVTYLLIYAAIAVGVCVADSLRWFLVARTLGEAPVLLRFISARLAGDAVGSLAPIGKVGGDPVRAVLLKSDGVAGSRASAGVVIDRIMEVIGNAVCATVCVVVFALVHTVAPSWGAPQFVVVAMILPLLALALLLRGLRRGRHPLTTFAMRTPFAQRPRFRQWIEALRHTENDLTRFFRDHPAAFVWGIGASLLIEVIIIVEYGVLFGAFGLRLDLSTLLMIVVTTGLARAAPVPAGLGALEAGQVTVLTIASGRPDIGLVVGTVLRVHETLWIAVGLLALSGRGWSLARVWGLSSTGRAAA